MCVQQMRNLTNQLLQDFIQKIHLDQSQCYDKYDNLFIDQLDQFLNYFQFKQNDPNSIGYLCLQQLIKLI
ncbi:unnamed protein product [Paramecium sonneborni]|uniref:Uncharacterized protein n=1 Tax=Paramecium sonneborni TaxID=65129 RepID=A0A8S1REJ2_9CILI|nr:unnamed protein product [Paramecium sonneborni]